MGEAKSKQMDCPAVGRRIKPQECGENRISNYDCPTDCPNNPWTPNNYDRAIEIQERSIEKMISRLRAEQVRTLGYVSSMPEADSNRGFDFWQWFFDQFFLIADASGKTFWQRWKDDRCTGLNNDQCVYIEAESTMRVTVLEIHEICDEIAVWAVDLLDPNPTPFLVLDRTLAKTACRFTSLLCAVYDLPHYSLIDSDGYTVPNISGWTPGEVFMEIATHLGAPLPLPERHDWIVHNLCRVVDSLQAVAKARHEAMRRTMDMAYTRTAYEIKCSIDTFHRILEKARDIDACDLSDEERDAGFVQAWDALSGKSHHIKGEALLGRVLLHGDAYLQIEASSSERSDQLKQRIDKLFGKQIRFSRERTDDLAAQHSKKRKNNYDPALVPERLMQNVTEVETVVSRIKLDQEGLSRAELDEQIEQKFMKTFLDNSIPLLHGLTPRQAAKDPALRPCLVEIMKSYVHNQDENNLRNGRNTDINWMLEELGLDEINFPPPPPARQAVEEDFEENDFDNENDFDAAELLMLDDEQIAQGISDLDAKYPDGKLVELLNHLYPLVGEDLAELCGPKNIEALSVAMQLAAHVALIQFVPDKPADRNFFQEDIDSAHNWIIDLLKEGIDPTNELRQPYLSVYVFHELENQMRFGQADPLFPKLYVYLTALTEVVDKNYTERLFKVFNND
ncbi:MAG: hypothetical protein JXR23_07815 [Pontiellaceae bacterium]|nr:hypothetical protein [Pontiellaceae bacterium]